jgi:hypothetical protein
MEKPEHAIACQAHNPRVKYTQDEHPLENGGHQISKGTKIELTSACYHAFGIQPDHAYACMVKATAWCTTSWLW